MAVGKRLSVLLLLTLSFACVPAATRAAESEATLTAKFTISPEHPEVGSKVTFDGHESKDTDGTIKNYEWEFGDGTSTSGSEAVVVSNTYTKKGPYQVTLTVEDTGGTKSSPKTKTLIVSGRPQAIEFTSTAPSSTSVGGSPYTVTASGGESGNPVELTIDGASKSVCALSGNSSGSTVSFQGAGTCTIDANQAGNEKYEPAPEAKQSFTVAKDAQAIEFTSVPPSNATVGGSTYTVTAAASSGEPVTLTIDAASASVCKLSGSMSDSIVSFIGTGTCTIDANQAGNETYEPAPQAQQSFAVASAAGSSSSSGSSSTGSSQSSSSTTPPAASHPVVISSTSPKGSFRAVSAMLHAPSYIITLQESLDEAGTLTWVLTFPNGPFGAYTAKSKKCRAGRIRLAGRCLPANILFGRGKQTFPAPGVVTITIKPTRSARRAFANAKRKHRNIKLTAKLTFQPTHGGAQVVRTQVLTIRMATSK